MNHQHSSLQRDHGFKQLIAAPFTPLHADGRLHLEMIDRQAQLLVDQHIRGVFVCGTTGEGASLSNDERKRVAERWVKVAGGSLTVLVHVGHSSAAEAGELSRHAQQIGADGIAACAPSFFKPRTSSELATWCSQVAAQAPDLPFYYYHMPSLTGVSLAMADFIPVARAQIPTWGGIKFTHENLMDYARCLECATTGEEIFFGRDEILLAALALGARSAVGSTYNFAAPIYHRLIAAFECGDLLAARQAQSQSREIVAVISRYGGLPAQKAIMQWLGVDCGPCRSPLTTLSTAQQEQLRAELDRIGFFAWVLS